MLDELEKHFGLNRYALPRSVKVLVLAPNTREADIWGKVLREELRSAEHIFVPHSNVPDPHGEIERFVRSRSGFLVAVDMAKLGFNDPDLDALVIARPVRNTAVYVRAHIYALIANVSPIKPTCVVSHHAGQNAKHYAAYRSKGQSI